MASKPPMIFEGTGCANGTEYSAKLKEERAAADQMVFLSRAEADFILQRIEDLKEQALLMGFEVAKAAPFAEGLEAKLNQAFPK